jgi:multimeric flavodoxin WrbA
MDRDLQQNRRAFLAVAGAAAAATLSAGAEEPAPTDPIRILAISCSPRPGMTTAAGLGIVLEGVRSFGRSRVETELIELAGKNIPVFNPASTDLGDFAELIPKLSDPAVRGIVVGTPVYFSGMSSLCKAFLDQCMAFRKGGMLLRNRVAGILAVGGVRNGGQELAIAGVQAGLMCQEMIVVGDGRPSAHTGATLVNTDGSIDKDEFGKETARNLGRRVAEVALLLAGRA